MSELRQREPRERCKAYLDHIRTMPCLICANNIETEAAHIRMACLEFDKDETGSGRKSSDRWALPLCGVHHREQHAAGSEILFWCAYKLDALAIAMRLWTAWRKATGWTPPAPKQSQKPRMKRSSPKTSRPKAQWATRKLQSRNTFKRQER